MKSVYYRSRVTTPASLAILLVASLMVWGVTSVVPAGVDADTGSAMRAAMDRTLASFDAIRDRRRELGSTMLRMHDPGRTGMLGPSMSRVTTLPGHLDAKQTTVNANFAAVAVRYFRDVGAVRGDVVAIGCTGSFPALNIAVLQAAEALGLDVVVVSSAASSQFGANDPDMMWPDMERLLVEAGLMTTRAVATTRGGFQDSAAGMEDDTRRLIDQSIERSGGRLLVTESIEDSIRQRMEIFQRYAGERPVVAYVNIGGGDASVGGTDGNDILGHGVVAPSAAAEIPDSIDSVARQYLLRGVPLINFTGAASMARRFGLTVAVPRGGLCRAGDRRRLGGGRSVTSTAACLDRAGDPGGDHARGAATAGVVAAASRRWRNDGVMIAGGYRPLRRSLKR